MTYSNFKYTTSKYCLSSTAKVFETGYIEGIKCVWSGKVVDDKNDLNFTFKFISMEKIEIVGLEGYILIWRDSSHELEPFRIVIDSIEFGDTLGKSFRNIDACPEPVVIVEYCLTHAQRPKIEEISYEVMFSESDKTDAILVVDEKKLHVSKEFLSYHSEYFRALFTPTFEEGQMDEIPIEDVSYDDFGCLLSIVHPQCSFPNDENAEKLLELADRFMMPFVTRQVEHHLLNTSKIELEKMMWMADKYSMTALLKKSIQLMNSVEKAKKVNEFPEYEELSDKTKAAFFERLLRFI